MAPRPAASHPQDDGDIAMGLRLAASAVEEAAAAEKQHQDDDDEQGVGIHIQSRSGCG
jgi:hypothetical protein